MFIEGEYKCWDLQFWVNKLSMEDSRKYVNFTESNERIVDKI